MNKLEELNKDLEFRRMCRYSDDWLEGYRTARLEEINVVESALAEQPQVNKEQVRWLLEKHTEHHWSKAATINIAALTKGFNALLSAPATPGPVSTVPGGTLGYETTSYGAKYLEPAADDAVAAERERCAKLEAKLSAIVKWLEKNQEDVFRRGLWDAINAKGPL